MGSSLRKIGLLILAIIILPVLIFSVYEIGNLRQNEKVIQDIYRNQLDAMLFSINQYSDDIISNLASRIENIANSYHLKADSGLNQLIMETPSVIALVQYNAAFEPLLSVPHARRDSIPLALMTEVLSSNKDALQRLQTYMRGGYRKIELLNNPGSGKQWIAFYTLVKGQYVTNVLIIDQEKFISQMLDPKIQEIAKGKFDIVAYREGEDQPIYSSNKQPKTFIIKDKKPFWLLKNYLMGIELKDMTIDDLARERIRKNLLIIGLMDILLLSGAWMIFRNIRKQVELSQLKSDFVSSVSHEIRTPLALISMYIETLDMGRVKSADKIKEYYSVILNETTRLSGIVNRILSFSQVENNKRNYVFSDTGINEVVESAALTFHYTLDNKGFIYTFKPDKSLPPITADREAITDALVNLIDNAMKYSTDQKEILVRTGKIDKYIYVEVEDHGIGISDKNQKFIFDKFFRVTDKDLANRVKGSGLGLAIVKHIMDAHKGKIYVKSTPGSGSLFRLLFPVK